MWLFKSFDKAAKKALSLEKDPLFGLLVVMMILLGWLASTGAASMMGLERVYQNWQLVQKSQLTVYLMPDSSPDDMADLKEQLHNLDGVRDVNELGQADVLALLKPFQDEDSPLALPKLIDVDVSADVDRSALDKIVYDLFPLAEIDDARNMLAVVSHGVRLMQMAALIIAGIVFVVMTLLMILTVRSGLQMQKPSLRLMQFIGARDDFVIELITRQICLRALVGAGGAMLLTALTLGSLIFAWPQLGAYLGWSVWLVGLVIPVVLVAIVVFTAAFTAKRHLTQKRDGKAV